MEKPHVRPPRVDDGLTITGNSPQISRFSRRTGQASRNIPARACEDLPASLSCKEAGVGSRAFSARPISLYPSSHLFVPSPAQSSLQGASSPGQLGGKQKLGRSRRLRGGHGHTPLPPTPLARSHSSLSACSAIYAIHCRHGARSLSAPPCATRRAPLPHAPV